MAQSDKPKLPRNILVEPDLELEMSGINERGIKPPPIRLPGKTHLAGVLLMANPWEQRDLDRKLTELNRLQVQRERAHLWTQRRFFMNTIFDQDMSLRFGKLEVEKDKKEQERKLADTPANNQAFSREKSLPVKRPFSSEQRKVHTGMEGMDPLEGEKDLDEDGLPPRPGMLYRSRTDLSRKSHSRNKNTLGIFANPLPENQRKFKIRSTTAGVNRRARPPPKSNSRADVVTKEGEETPRVLTPTMGQGNEHTEQDPELHNGSYPAVPSLMEKSKTAPHILLRRATTGLDLRRDAAPKMVTPNDATSAMPRRKLRPGVSFKQGTAPIMEDQGNDPYEGFERQPSMAMGELREERRPPSTYSHPKSLKSAGRSREAICDEDVIVNLTRTLPTALMLKANANLNAVINKRKENMMTVSRRLSTQDTFADQRWLKLEESLCPLTPREETVNPFATLMALTNPQE